MNFQSHFISYRQPLFCFHSNFLKLRCGMGIRYFRQVTMKYSPNHAAAITSARPILVCSWRHCASICVCCRGIQCQDSRAKSAHVVRSHPSEPDPVFNNNPKSPKVNKVPNHKMLDSCHNSRAPPHTRYDVQMNDCYCCDLWCVSKRSEWQVANRQQILDSVNDISRRCQSQLTTEYPTGPSLLQTDSECNFSSSSSSSHRTGC